jgi:hypothetical protein
VDSYPGPLFCSTGLHVCFCASTMLFLLLWLCSIVWSQVLWYLQHCSGSVLLWLFRVFCASKWTLWWVFNLCDECHRNVDGDCIEQVDSFGNIAIFTILILPIHEHGKSFYLL